MSLFRHLRHIEPEVHFLSGTVEVVKNTEPFGRVHIHTFGTERIEVSDQVRADAREIRSRFLNVLFDDRDRDIFLLHDPVGVSGFFAEHIVVFRAVHREIVVAFRHKDILLEVIAVELVIVDRDLRRRSAVKGVQQFRIGEEHRLLIFLTGDKVVDVVKAERLCESAPDLENAVFVNAGDRDIIVDAFRNLVRFFILTEHCFE